MMSPHDVMIVCSIILAGKPLHMCRRSAVVCLHFCRHPCQLTVSTKSSECHHFVSEPIFVPVTLSPRYFSVPRTVDPFINKNSNLNKYTKTRRVNV